MKGVVKALVICCCCFAFFSPETLAGFSVGDEACVLWNDDLWYRAQVTEVGEERIRVHYPGYDATQDEYVKPGAMTVPMEPSVGDKVWIFWKESYGKAFYFEAQVMALETEGYRIHYLSDGEDTTWDETVGSCRIFPIPQKDDYLWATPYASASSWAYGRVIEHSAIDTFKIRYGGYSDWGTWHEYEDDLSPPQLIPASPDGIKTIAEAFADHAPAALPSGNQVYTFSPVVDPVVKVNTPSKIKPIGLGSAAMGGETLDVVFDPPEFAHGVDIYFGIALEGSPEIYLFGQDKTFHPLSTEGLVPAITQEEWPIITKVLENVPVASLGKQTLEFYLLVNQKGDMTSTCLWYTSLAVNQAGRFTGKETACTKAGITALTAPLIQEMVTKGSSDWYAQLSNFVTGHLNDAGEADSLEALTMIALAAYGRNNVYPFCWAALKALEENSSSPHALNTAAVCLFELDEIDKAGALLDCAYNRDSTLSITHTNGGAFHARRGDVKKALEWMESGVDLSPPNPHAAWDGYHYALARNEAASLSFFRSRIPENFSLKNNDGTIGTGKKELIVCCNCNGGIYRDLGQCLDECTVSLACFTHICSPRLSCCDGKGPFSFDGGFCYPPKGLQVCIETDDTGTTGVKLGVSLEGIFSGYVGVSSNFSGNHSLFLEGATLGSKVKTTVLTTDPNTRNWSSQHQAYISTGVGGLSMSANASPADWAKGVHCEFNTPQ